MLYIVLTVFLWAPTICILSISVFLPLFLLSLVIMQLFRKVPFCVLVCILYPFWYTLWLFLSLNTATAIIAGHSYLNWKQQSSESSEPLKISFDMFQSSAAFKNIQNAIENLDGEHTDVVATVVKIALDNQLCKSLIVQQKFVIPFSYTHFSSVNFTTHFLHGFFEWCMFPHVNYSVGS